MRKILFKAKREDNGEWITGGSIIQFLDNGEMSFYMPNFNEKCICVHDEKTDNIEKFEHGIFYKIKPETICQYTGINDKDGNQIFENDIVQYIHIKYPEPYLEPISIKPTKYKGNYKVEFVNTKFTYGLRLRKKSIHFPITKSSIDNHGVKIIGNIFDNPELLEEP